MDWKTLKDMVDSTAAEPPIPIKYSNRRPVKCWTERWAANVMQSTRVRQDALHMMSTDNPHDWLRLHLPAVIGDIQRTRPNVRFTTRTSLGVGSSTGVWPANTVAVRKDVTKALRDAPFDKCLDTVVDTALKGGLLWCDPCGLLAVSGLRYPRANNYMVASSLIYFHIKDAFAVSGAGHLSADEVLEFEGSSNWEIMDRLLWQMVK